MTPSASGLSALSQIPLRGLEERVLLRNKSKEHPSWECGDIPKQRERAIMGQGWEDPRQTITQCRRLLAAAACPDPLQCERTSMYTPEGISSKSNLPHVEGNKPTSTYLYMGSFILILGNLSTWEEKVIKLYYEGGFISRKEELIHRNSE